MPKPSPGRARRLRGHRLRLGAHIKNSFQSILQTNYPSASLLNMAVRPRFIKSLRERRRNDGTTDRYWVVIDRDQRFTVLKVSVSYPGAEPLAMKYMSELNAKAMKEMKAANVQS